MMDDEEPEGKAEEKDSSAGAPPKGKQTSGWGSPSAKDEEPSKKAVTTTDEEEVDEDQPKGRRKNLRDMEDDETEMVMMIPDLDEDESEDITLQVAAAPKSVARRVQSLQQVSQFLPIGCYLVLIVTLDQTQLCGDVVLQIGCAFSQLDHDIKYTIPSGGGLDLSFLTSALVPPAMVEESDTLWDFDSLLQQVILKSLLWDRDICQMFVETRFVK